MPWPTAGANTGTRMNTVMTKDITRAISRPLYLSRTRAIETMRGPEAPNPCRNRPSSICVKSTATIDNRQPKRNSNKPDRIAGRRPMEFPKILLSAKSPIQIRTAMRTGFTMRATFAWVPAMTAI